MKKIIIELTPKDAIALLRVRKELKAGIPPYNINAIDAISKIDHQIQLQTMGTITVGMASDPKNEFVKDLLSLKI